MSKKGKVGCSGREIQAQLYGTRGRPLSPLEQTREEDNAHLGRIAERAREEAWKRGVAERARQNAWNRKRGAK